MRQQVEDGRIFGSADGMLKGQGDDAGAEADALGAGGDVGQEHQRRGEAAFVAVEMVLGHPGAVEAVRFGVDYLVGGVVVALAGAGIVEQPGEEA